MKQFLAACLSGECAERLLLQFGKNLTDWKPLVRKRGGRPVGKRPESARREPQSEHKSPARECCRKRAGHDPHNGCLSLVRRDLHARVGQDLQGKGLAFRKSPLQSPCHSDVRCQVGSRLKVSPKAGAIQRRGAHQRKSGTHIALDAFFQDSEDLQERS
jgi:hypothetical protein